MIQSLNLNALLNEGNNTIPMSALTIAGSAANPILLLGTVNARSQTSHVVAIDLQNETLAWAVNIQPAFGSDVMTHQFPIVIDPADRARVVAAGRTSGPYFIGEP